MIDIIFTYYNNPTHLYRYLKYLNSSILEEKLLKNVCFTFVDDYSDKDKRAIDVFREFDFKINVKLYTILEDKGYNTGGARNVGCLNSTADMLVSLDIDNIITNDNLSEIVTLKQIITDDKLPVCYKFTRCIPAKTFDYKKGTWEFNKHSAAFIINKKLFCDGNFFDEDFSGHHGFEDYYFFRVLKYKKIPIKYTKSLLFVDKTAATPNIDRRDQQIAKHGKQLTKQMYDGKRKIKHLPTNPLRFKYELTYTNMT